MTGAFTIFLGYKLFTKGIFDRAGDLEATWTNYSILVKKAAPGTFFALFGALVILLSIFKGFSYESKEQAPQQVSGQSQPSLQDSIHISKDSLKLKL